MNKQTSRLLTILLNSPGQFYSYAELAEMLSVTSRSIRNYIQSIFQFLDDKQISKVLHISEGGVTFTGEQREIDLILEEVIDAEFYLYRLSPDERTLMIILNLLLLDDYINLIEISEKFNVSRTTALKDMEQVKRYFRHRNIGFDPSMKKGYLLQIEEAKRRDMIFEIAQNGLGNIVDSDQQINIYKKFLYDEWDLEQYELLLKKILLQTEEKYGLEVSDINFEEVLLSLQIMVKRLEQGRRIQNYGENQTFQDKTVYQLSEYILKQVKEYYKTEIEPAEIEYLAGKLYYCRFYYRALIQESRDIRMHMALSSFLLKISEELDIPVFENRVTAEQLESHLQAIDKAHLEEKQIKNDYTEQMIKEYPQYFKLICKYRPILENILEYQYTRDDLAVILIYLVVMIEYIHKADHLPRVVVVCHTGIGTANFLAEKLKSNFNIEILKVTSNHKLEETIEKCCYDLIVSTVSLEIPKEKWIKVSPMLKDEDILKLQKLFMDIKKDKKQCTENIGLNTGKENREIIKQGNMTSILEEKYVILDQNCYDWADAIRTAARPLFLDGLIEERYISEMIRSVEVNGAYFVYAPGVALIHAGPIDGVNSFGLSLLRLNPPVCFGHKHHDPVTYVICMAIREKDDRLKEIMKLMEIFSNSEAIQELDQIKESKQFINCLVKKEELL